MYISCLKLSRFQYVCYCLISLWIGFRSRTMRIIKINTAHPQFLSNDDKITKIATIECANDLYSNIVHDNSVAKHATHIWTIFLSIQWKKKKKKKKQKIIVHFCFVLLYRLCLRRVDELFAHIFGITCRIQFLLY